jgi:hypothetical protein
VLQRLFASLSVDLPGLYAERESSLFLAIPRDTLATVIAKLDEPALALAWNDDTTLGWVYQYWNDPEREAIDAQLDAQRKLESCDIASKTQVFTERYMVEWLLENSLGQLWLRICKKHGWVSEYRRNSCYVTEPIGDERVANAPDSIRSIRLLDPACGSGHFLVTAFDMLVAMYREEATYRGEIWSDAEVAESILANNLYGIDIDADAVRVAATVLYVKAKTLSRNARPYCVNLVAPTFYWGTIDIDSPPFISLCFALERDAGASLEVTRRLVNSVVGIEYLGTLLNVDTAIEDAGLLKVRATLLEHLGKFFEAYAQGEDLGLRLGPAQLERGIRFLRMNQSGYYDVIVGNPPYFGTQALADAKYIDKHYPQSKENLCTALLDRAMQLVRPTGLVAFVTVRNWLYVSQLSTFRKRVFSSFPPKRVVDLGLGGFESLPSVEGVMLVLEEGADGECFVVRAKGNDALEKRSSITEKNEYYRTDTKLLAKLPGSPFVYRWSRSFVDEFLSHPSLSTVAPVRVGMKTSDNLRFLRYPWELSHKTVREAIESPNQARYVPYVKGAGGKAWIEPLSMLVDWRNQGLEIRIALRSAYGQGPQGEKHFFRRGVAFSTIGRSFLARAHRYPSLFDVAGSSVFPENVAETVCLLNSRFARAVIESLNPTINFQVGDVGRVPFCPDPEANAIFAVLERAFSEHEFTDECSPRFKKPGASPWRFAQTWAQRAVDRVAGAPLPTYEPQYDETNPFAFISYGVGVALGRFGANGEGVLDRAPANSLPNGILFLTTEGRDSLEHPACELLRTLWKRYFGENGDVRRYLRNDFFGYHKKVYENRPIYLPLASAKRNFVAFVSIHRWHADTLNALRFDYLIPAQRRIEAELEGLRRVEQPSSQTEKRSVELSRLLEELVGLRDAVTELAECGPRTPDEETQTREVDAPFEFNLDDGVLVNSAALWPLLEPYWKEPRKWWALIANRSGPKGAHFDWSTVAKRYFPERVEAECRDDVVLASAHRCLRRYHPESARTWELRLKERFGADYSIDNEGDELARVSSVYGGV